MNENGQEETICRFEYSCEIRRCEWKQKGEGREEYAEDESGQEPSEVSERRVKLGESGRETKVGAKVSREAETVGWQLAQIVLAGQSGAGSPCDAPARGLAPSC